MEIVRVLKDLIINKDDIFSQINTLPNFILTTLNENFEKINNTPNLKYDDLVEVESVIDFLHDELNTGHWSKVSIAIRHAFTIASFIKTCIQLCILQQTEENMKKIIQCTDLGILMGAPLPSPNENVLTSTATHLIKHLKSLNFDTDFREKTKLKNREHLDCNQPVTKRPCLKKSFEITDADQINTVKCPSVEIFHKNYFTPEKPVKLLDCMSNWPAATKWKDINYFIEIAGERTVPVEIGSHYVDENWSQKLMTLKEFIEKHFIDSDKTENLGYLAQHNLFDQIPELQSDIIIPDYCCLSQDYENSSEPDINAWFGPKGTVSPLHFDPKHNLLAQVFGTKQIFLFSPDDSSNLYPHEGMLNNTAQVNPLEPDFEKFPNLRNTKMYKCLLNPGEILYMPPKWWHHITALEPSFSVSFWWH